MIPESSALYTHTLETVQAPFPRYPNSVAPGNPPDVLKVCYRRYKASHSAPRGTQTLNMVFLHGTGMNKGIFHYHIDQLYEKCHTIGVHVNLVLAVDSINHGLSAAANKGKLGSDLDWRDIAYDVARIAELEKSDLLHGDKNLLVGHSMAGAVSLYLSFLRPALFDAVVVLNPVCYRPGDGSFPPHEPFVSWRNRGYMETEFQANSAEWRQQIREYMANKSFYRGFDPRVLDNMIEDEIPLDPVDWARGATVKLHTSQKQTLITYFGSNMSLSRIEPVFSGIEVPVYRILGELDTASPSARARLERAIPAMKTCFLPGEKHLLHGIHPDLFVETLMTIIEERRDAEGALFSALYCDVKL